MRMDIRVAFTWTTCIKHFFSIKLSKFCSALNWSRTSDLVCPVTSNLNLSYIKEILKIIANGFGSMI